MGSETSGAYFSVIQLTPTAALGERINVAVLAADATGARIQLLANWNRAKRFSGGNLAGVRAMLERLRGRIESDSGLDVEAVRRLAERDHGALSFTELRASTESVDTLLASAAKLYLVERPHSAANLRGRAEVKHLVRAVAREALRKQVSKPEDVEALLAGSLRGQSDEHSFDAVVGNGRKIGVLHGLSFEEGQEFLLIKDAHALAFGISDVKLMDSSIDAGVMALPPKQNETKDYARMLDAYERAKRVVESVHATVLDEQTVPAWLGDIAAVAVKGAGQGIAGR